MGDVLLQKPPGLGARGRLKALMPPVRQSGGKTWRRLLAADLLQVQQTESRCSIADCINGDGGCLVSLLSLGVNTLV
jgi:hypothetical protein